MRKVEILAVGDLKDSWLKEGCQEFLKRLGIYADIRIKELKEESIPQKSSPAIDEKIKETEGARILKEISPTDFLVVLDLNHKEPDSLELSKTLDDWFVRGGSKITFAIGGSLGVSEDVRKRANAFLTLSKLTFTHRMSRLILLEAIYRSFRILNGEPYHK